MAAILQLLIASFFIHTLLLIIFERAHKTLAAMIDLLDSIALVSEDAKVTLYRSELSEREIERVKTYMEIIEEKLKMITEDIRIEFMDGQFALVEFCNLMSKEADALIVFQALKKIENDAQRITLSLCKQASNVLIFPPL